MIDLTAEEQQAIAPLLRAADTMAQIAYEAGKYARPEDGLAERHKVRLQAALLVARAWDEGHSERDGQTGPHPCDDNRKRIAELEAALGEAR